MTGHRTATPPRWQLVRQHTNGADELLSGHRIEFFAWLALFRATPRYRRATGAHLAVRRTPLVDRTGDVVRPSDTEAEVAERLRASVTTGEIPRQRAGGSA